MLKNFAHILYHMIILLLSAACALFIPYALGWTEETLLSFGTFIENEKISGLTLEAFTAISLILFFNFVAMSWKYRRVARMAKMAGLVLVVPPRGILARRRLKNMKKELGFARELMIIGSTGYRSLLEPEGDLHEAVQHCREAKIMLLNPFKEGAANRAQSIPDPRITPELIQEQIMTSINYLKELQAVQQNVRLKLYPDQPLLKLVIVGDYVFLRHYGTGKNICQLPEYAFRNEQKHSDLYVPLYCYFQSRWQDPNIPEYDLKTDELIYRDADGNEVYREIFNLSKGASMPPDKKAPAQTVHERFLEGYHAIIHRPAHHNELH